MEAGRFGKFQALRHMRRINYFRRLSSETLNFFLPRARRRASTFRPFLVAILERNPCLLARLRLEGWYVLFMMAYFSVSCMISARMYLRSDGFYKKEGKITQSLTLLQMLVIFYPFILAINSSLLVVPCICLRINSMASSGFISAR